MISVVIPAYNDVNIIGSTIEYLKANAYTRLVKEIIVVDGGSSDGTPREAEKAGAKVIYLAHGCRSSQLNHAVQYASGKILYFLAPGTTPPKNYSNEIVRSVMRGSTTGTFVTNYTIDHLLLRFLSWRTIKKKFVRLEDQSLFVVKDLFIKSGGFREDVQFAEDIEFVSRLKRYGNFNVLPDVLLASSRNYRAGIFRYELSYWFTRFMRAAGYPNSKLPKLFNFLSAKKEISFPQRRAYNTSFGVVD